MLDDYDYITDHYNTDVMNDGDLGHDRETLVCACGCVVEARFDRDLQHLRDRGVPLTEYGHYQRLSERGKRRFEYFCGLGA